MKSIRRPLSLFSIGAASHFSVDSLLPAFEEEGHPLMMYRLQLWGLRPDMELGLYIHKHLLSLLAVKAVNIRQIEPVVLGAQKEAAGVVVGVGAGAQRTAAEAVGAAVVAVAAVVIVEGHFVRVAGPESWEPVLVVQSIVEGFLPFLALVLPPQLPEQIPLHMFLPLPPLGDETPLQPLSLHLHVI